jgi:serine/threonine protein kinase
LIPAINSDDFDFNRIKPLLKAALVDEPVDALIWDEVYSAVTESTPPPRPIISSIHQTPWLRNTSSFANSSEHRKYVDDVLKEELGSMYVGLRGFHETYFGGVADLKTASEVFFEQCQQGSSPRFDDGWQGWPAGAKQDDVLSWFTDFSEELATFAEGRKPTPTRRRRPLAKPNDAIDGSTGKRKMDIGFVDIAKTRKDSKYHWSQVLVPGELKSVPSADKASEAWLDLGRYAREVLSAQDSRRFVLGFTICGSLMRVWVFDRLGGIASEQFDINKNGLHFVSTILGFLWMDEEQLGFDPTITTEGGQRFVTITRNGQTERLVIGKVMKRAPCIAGRATTCWKAYREDDPQTPLVIKDSWQYTEREEEGELLREATDKSVVNVARYYHHETVLVRGQIDDIKSSVRGGLNVMEAENYRPERPARLLSTGAVGIPRKGRSTNTAGVKRTSSQAGASLPPSKRTCSASPTKAGSGTLPNRVHRRVILRDFGKPIYEASSCSALLGALEGCIKGHESLHSAGFLHRDISINNLMINEDADNPSWPSFLIDLDLAIKESRDGASGARGKTGTRAFMAIGALLGEQHSFMHDLESFFWVLFWICIHFDGPNESRVVPRFEKWNYLDTEELASDKRGVIADEVDFLRIMEEYFTSSLQTLTPSVNRLRRVVFPNGERWKKTNPQLHSSMMDILRESQQNLNISVDK